MSSQKKEFSLENQKVEYEVRDYKPEDKAAIIKLWKKVYSFEQIKRRIRSFIRLSEENYVSPKGKFNTYNILLHNKIPIGYIGSMPAIFYIFGKKQYGYYLHDSLIDKTYRGKGLGLFLMKKVTDKTNSFIIALWMNQAQYNLTKKSQWLDISGCHSFISIINLRRYLTIKNDLLGTVINFFWKGAISLNRNYNNKNWCNYRLEEIDHFENNINDFVSRASLGYNIIQCRESGYLNWKYSNFPTKSYYKFLVFKNEKLAGYVVLTEEPSNKGGKIGIVADLLVEKGDTETFHFLISKSLDFFNLRESDYVACLILPREFRSILRKLLFFKTRKPVRLMITNYEELFTEEDVLDLHNWYLTYGDDDRVIW